MSSKKDEKTASNVNDADADNAENKPADKANAKQEKPPEKSGTFCVYLGPSIQGVITSGTIYDSDKKGTLKKLSRVIERFPMIGRLIVTGAALPESRLQIKKSGSLLYANYNKFVAQLKQGGKFDA